jgi:hypothetical protein
MIHPTIGRVVIVKRGSTDAQPDGWPVFVAKVYGERCINAAGFNEWGTPVSFSSLILLQDDDVPPPAGPYAEWMPYQKAVAATSTPPLVPASTLVGSNDTDSVIQTSTLGGQAPQEDSGLSASTGPVDGAPQPDSGPTTDTTEAVAAAT